MTDKFVFIYNARDEIETKILTASLNSAGIENIFQESAIGQTMRIKTGFCWRDSHLEPYLVSSY